MRNFLILVISLSLTVSCQDVIDFDVPQAEQTLNIYGRITDSVGTSVNVSLTSDYFEQGEIPVVSGARISLFENGNLVSVLDETHIPGEYFSSFNGSVGSSYHIEVEIPESYNVEPLWRSSPEIMRRLFTTGSLQLDSLTRRTTPQVFEPGFYALLSFSETPGEGDYYRFRRWLNDSLFEQELLIWEDSNVDGAHFYRTQNGGNDTLPPFTIYGPMETGDSLLLETTSISEQYYDYLRLVNEQVFQVGGPFDPPPSPIIGNIYNANDPEDYGFGFFAASAVQRYRVTRQN